MPGIDGKCVAYSLIRFHCQGIPNNRVIVGKGVAYSLIRFHCQGIPNNRVSWSATQYHHRRHIQKAWQPEEAAGVVILKR